MRTVCKTTSQRALVWSAAILYTWVAEPEETENQDALTQEAETEAPDLEQITDAPMRSRK